MPGDDRSSERFLYTINRTFNLPTKHIHTEKVIGTGQTLGLTNGSQLGGLQPWNERSIGNVMNITTSAYDKNVGVSTTGGTSFSSQISVGVTQTEGKSGLKVVRDPNIIMVIKY